MDIYPYRQILKNEGKINWILHQPRLSGGPSPQKNARVNFFTQNSSKWRREEEQQLVTYKGVLSFHHAFYILILQA